MIKTNTIAANIAAIFFLTTSYTSSAHAEEQTSSYKIDCEKSKQSNIIHIHSYIEQATQSKITTSNKSTINIHTSPQSHSTLSFSLDNFPISIELSSNNKSRNFFIDSECSVTQGDYSPNLERDIRVDKDKINADIQGSNVDINELSTVQLENNPYYFSYNPTTLIIPHGYYNNYTDNISSVNTYISLSFKGSYHELITIKQN